MKKGNVLSDQPVEIKLPNGTLTANGMEIVDSGDVVRFTRGVVLDLDRLPPGGGEAMMRLLHSPRSPLASRSRSRCRCRRAPRPRRNSLPAARCRASR